MWRFLGKWPLANQHIYLDYASATPVLPEALYALENAMRLYANPGAIHGDGVASMRSLTDSRERIAHHLGCKARELIFTSGGTEANNLAILGFARAIERKSPRSNLGDRGSTSVEILSSTHWIVSSIEHPSVLACFAEIERLGGRVDFVDPEPTGLIDPAKIVRALRPETVFISIGWANGEIGTMQLLSHIARVLRTHEKNHGTSIIFHSDAGQASLYDASNIHSLGVDILSLDSGKLYGPRGIGCVYLNDRATLAPIMLGGGQERGLRAGTENVALAAGFAEALALVARERKEERTRLQTLRDYFARKIVT
ncbi:MAG TPA: aminotransferase class V-fold PLP-dependent enzyme, partial [Candidatus Paceibacterota bacterium]|nr:aminotransferase class V-fold PLP-dependent enzyme [Candidatus Paceibacterota bacterium]